MNDDITLNDRIRNDGWGSLLTGMGTRADKNRSKVHTADLIISDLELESIYNDDGLGAKVIDCVADDMFKRGWEYRFENEKDDTENKFESVYNELFKAMQVKQKLNEAVKWARLYGGCVAIIGAYDGEDFSTPLVPKKIKKFEPLRVIPRPNIQYGTMIFQTDPMLPRFGEVEFYPVEFRVGNDFRIMNVHHSRVIEIHGVKCPNTIATAVMAEYRYWGMPVFQKIKDYLSSVGSNFNAVAHLFDEYSVGKYKLNDLAEILSVPDGEKSVNNRIQVMDMMKSVYHSLILDSNDDYIRENVSFGGIGEVMNLFFEMISASTNIPMTRLFGISPSGLNATGDSDTYSYYDMVEAQQELKLRPALEKLVSIVSEYKNIEKPEIEFKPIEQMTEKEQAELEERKANTERVKAETYKAYYDLGIMEPWQIEQLEFKDTLKNLAEPSVMPEVGEVE